MLVNSFFNICYMYSSHTMPSYADHSLIFGTHALERTSVILGAPCKNPPVRTQNNLLFSFSVEMTLFHWPLTFNLTLTLQQFSLLFLFTSLSSSFLQHVCDITSLHCSLNTCLGLFCQITQRDITVCPIKPYLCSRPLRDLFFVLPFFFKSYNNFGNCSTTKVQCISKIL